MCVPLLICQKTIQIFCISPLLSKLMIRKTKELIILFSRSHEDIALNIVKVILCLKTDKSNNYLYFIAILEYVLTHYSSFFFSNPAMLVMFHLDFECVESHIWICSGLHAFDQHLCLFKGHPVFYYCFESPLDFLARTSARSSGSYSSTVIRKCSIE